MFSPYYYTLQTDLLRCSKQSKHPRTKSTSSRLKSFAASVYLGRHFSICCPTRSTHSSRSQLRSIVHLFRPLRLDSEGRRWPWSFGLHIPRALKHQTNHYPESVNSKQRLPVSRLVNAPPRSAHGVSAIVSALYTPLYGFSNGPFDTRNRNRRMIGIVRTGRIQRRLWSRSNWHGSAWVQTPAW